MKELNQGRSSEVEMWTRERFYTHLNRIRVWTQLLTLLFLFAFPVLNLLGIYWIIGSFYSISIGSLDISDPALTLQTILLTKQVYVPLLIATLLPVILALIFGRVFCSWMCPQNTLSEWIDTIKKKFFRKRWQEEHFKDRGRNPNVIWYWGIFGSLVLLTWMIGFPLLSYLSMPGVISSQVVQGILGMGVGLEVGLVVLILAVETALGKRFWCKYVCPVGACLAIFRTKKTLNVAHDEQLCDCKSNAEPCHDICPFNLSPKHPGIYPYCFNCGLCISVCEKTGYRALSLSFDDIEGNQNAGYSHTEAHHSLRVYSDNQRRES